MRDAISRSRYRPKERIGLDNRDRTPCGMDGMVPVVGMSCVPEFHAEHARSAEFCRQPRMPRREIESNVANPEEIWIPVND